MDLAFQNSHWMIIAFILGYVLIIVEHITRINKSTAALMMAIICWLFFFIDPATKVTHSLALLHEKLAGVSEIVFFLLGALGIVEIMSAHRSFKLLTDRLKINSKRKMLWVIGFAAFFLSSILDNLTTTIVMVTLLRRLVHSKHEQLVMGCAVVIAANAGGAWTPIGDVTTTMLWIGGQITSLAIMRSLFLPSLACLIAALTWFTFILKGRFPAIQETESEEKLEPMGRTIFVLGLASLIFVPIFKIMTGLPPFMGVLFGLAMLWLVTDIIHSRHEGRQHLRVPTILMSIDLQGLFFFLGILLSVAALESGGILHSLASAIDQWLPVGPGLAFVVGIVSAVVDNVPLVAASIGMYDLALYPPDMPFWQMLAYTAGTGGSLLIIGSAAGVAFMTMQNVSFVWYLRHATLPAFASYLVGFMVYIILYL